MKRLALALVCLAALGLPAYATYPAPVYVQPAPFFSPPAFAPVYGVPFATQTYAIAPAQPYAVPLPFYAGATSAAVVVPSYGYVSPSAVFVRQRAVFPRRSRVLVFP